ncbi:unnamed protein product [Spirodela intermedia]|uniref:Uncharacterized protein n=1 Tax=Spirodela intermedia TaxID=51605 RepID=A0A7I8JIW6_SPIIN|nr:unnamed protein product [Spirodela intermedia]CAA6670079.1 unnamed protein product [Spirodela intermedia]
MYVTRPLSLYRSSPGAASEPLPEGPYSGYLVIQDKAYEAQVTTCCGMYRDQFLSNLPFPQNHLLRARPGLPLSANRYYVVHAKGKHAGMVYACSREEDKSNFLCCSSVNDVNPRPFGMGQFYARAVATDGFPPYFLRLKDWWLNTDFKRKPGLDIEPAAGVNEALRARMPDASFPISSQRSPAAVVGKWYTPFFFIKEELFRLKDQVKRSLFYEVTLEQFWEAIHFSENRSGEGRRTVEVRARVQTETAMLCGGELVGDVSPSADRVVWFRPAESVTGAVGLSSPIVERMRWEVARAGWVAGKSGVDVLEREEEYRGGSAWTAFGCFVLVERFSLRRLDGSLVLGCDFRYTNKIITKWE